MMNSVHHVVFLLVIIAVSASAFHLAPEAKMGNGGRTNGTNLAAGCSAATQAAVKQCYTPFYKSFGLNANRLLPYAFFKGKIDTAIAAQGELSATQDVICKNRTPLSACLANVDGASACESYTSYEAMFGINSPADANQYMLFNAKYGYVCSNLNTFVGNYDCITAAKTKFESSFDTCDEAYHWAQKIGEDHCDAYSQLISCYSGTYSRACGLQVFSFECNVMEIPELFETPECAGKFPACGN